MILCLKAWSGRGVDPKSHATTFVITLEFEVWIRRILELGGPTRGMSIGDRRCDAVSVYVRPRFLSSCAHKYFHICKVLFRTPVLTSSWLRREIWPNTRGIHFFLLVIPCRWSAAFCCACVFLGNRKLVRERSTIPVFIYQSIPC